LDDGIGAAIDTIVQWIRVHMHGQIGIREMPVTTVDEGA
jgi:hypothetical protein